MNDNLNNKEEFLNVLVRSADAATNREQWAVCKFQIEEVRGRGREFPEHKRQCSEVAPSAVRDTDFLGMTDSKPIYWIEDKINLKAHSFTNILKYILDLSTNKWNTHRRSGKHGRRSVALKSLSLWIFLVGKRKIVPQKYTW